MQTRPTWQAQLWLAMLIALCFLLSLFWLPGCARNPSPNLSPAGQTAIYDTQIIKQLDILRDFAINLNTASPPLFPTNSTRRILAFHKSLVSIVATTPAGWKATAAATITQLQKDLPASDWTVILPYITLIQTLLTQVQ